MKAIQKKIFSGFMAMTMAGAMMWCDLPDSFNNGEQSTTIAACADTFDVSAIGLGNSREVLAAKKSNGKRSGKKKIYISHIGWRSNAITMCINRDSDVEFLINWLDEQALANSGGKYAAKIVSLFGGSNPVSKVLKKIFNSMSGVSSSARKAKKELIEKAKKKPSTGLKLTIRENGRWIVEYQ